jgi:taurine transport system substrate-binding protein
MKIVRTLIAAAAVSLAAPVMAAGEKTVVIAFPLEPSAEDVILADGLYEKETGYKVEWRKFETGPEALAALVGGSVDIADIGSSPMSVAATRGLPVKLILQDLIGASEELVARNGAGINDPQKDLVGKKIGVPFGSTAHFALLGALKHWGIKETDVTILNLPPSEIAAAWARGNIDAAYTWAPALTEILRTGKKLTDSAEVGSWGAPTFNGYIVADRFSRNNPEFVQKFFDLTAQAREDFAKNKWKADSPEVRKISAFLGVRPDDAVEVLNGHVFPSARELTSQDYFGGGTQRALKATAEFLHEQKKLDAVGADYNTIVDATYAKKAAEKSLY